MRTVLSKQEKGAFYKLIFPSMVEILFIQCFSFVDQMMVGHIPDSTVALAALSLCLFPMNVVVCVTAAFFIGTTAGIARNYGRGDKEEIKNISFQTMVLALVGGVIISIVTYFFSGNIMHFVCGDSEEYEIAAMYYRINAIGFMFQIVTMNITASFRGIGITRIPMIYNLLGNGTNVIFNYILIYGKLGFPAMNAKGAAIATVLSKVVMFLIAVPVWLFKKSPVKPEKGVTLKPCKSMRELVFPIGITSAGEQFILQFGGTVTAKIIAALPTADIAACSVVSSVESIAWSTGDACCTASTSLFGRCLGENRVDKSKAYLRQTACWAMGFAAFEILLIVIFGRSITSFFSNDTSIYDKAVEIMLVGSISLPFINMHKTVSGALRSSGDSKAPLLASLISLWVFRAGLGYLLISVFDKGVMAYRWCLNLDQFVRMVAMLIFYFTGHWKKKALPTAEK